MNENIVMTTGEGGLPFSETDTPMPPSKPPRPASLTIEETVWLQIYVALARHPTTSGDVALKWADRGLEEFKERFRNE